MLKRAFAILGFLFLAFPALGQVPGTTIQINRTPITQGTTGMCLYDNAGKVGEQACGTGTAADIKVGTTTVSSGTTTYLLYNNAGVLGNIPQSTFATATGTLTPGNVAQLTATGVIDSGVVLVTTLPATTVWSNITSGTAAPAANTVLTLGNGTAAAPIYSFVNETGMGMYRSSSGVLGLSAGGLAIATFNVPGASHNFIDFSANNVPLIRAQGSTNLGILLAANGTGGVDIQTNGSGSNPYIARFAVSGTAGAAVNYFTLTNALTTAPTILSTAGGDSVINLNIAPKGQASVVLNSAAIATNATDGFLYLASGAGTPTGTPTTFTGRVPMYVDTTNSQLWLYLGGAWKQPKTPAAAAIITWQ